MNTDNIISALHEIMDIKNNTYGEGATTESIVATILGDYFQEVVNYEHMFRKCGFSRVLRSFLALSSKAVKECGNEDTTKMYFELLKSVRDTYFNDTATLKFFNEVIN